MLAPIPWQGSKRKELKHIHNNEPKEFNKIIDVFGGGGSVSLSYINKDIDIIYNDKNESLYTLWLMLKNEDQTDIKILQEQNNKLSYSKEEYDKIINKEIILSPLLELLYKMKSNFKGMIDCNMRDTTRKVTHYDVSKFFKYTDQLKRFEIFNEDYKDIINKYKNDSNAFIYLDPPYISKKNEEYGFFFGKEDLNYIFDIMNDKETKAKIMLNVDYTGYTRETHPHLFKFCYPIRYELGTTNKDIYIKYHLILSNYKD